MPEEEVSTEAVEEAVGGEPTTPEAAVPAGNPAWEGIRAELDPISFSRIEQHLKGFDAEAQRHITKTNEEFKWAKEYQTQGVTPDQISRSLNLAKMIDETPEEVYERLGQFLRDNGRMPESAEELVEETEDPNEPAEDPRFAQLELQNQQMMAFLQDQQAREQAAQADAAVGNEIEKLKADHPEFIKDDIREVLQRAAIMGQQLGKEVTLEEAAADYNTSVRNRLLSTQRSGDLAPKLVPTNGSVPPANAQRTLGQLSRDETQNIVAGLIAKNNGS